MISWIEEKEGTANLWLVVTEPDGDEIRIPARRDFISHFSTVINDLPVAEDSECPIIGFDAETVVEFCRACLPRLDALPKIGNLKKLCKMVKLAHFLDAPPMVERWWAELQRYQPTDDTRTCHWGGDEYIAIFDLNRDLPGKTFSLDNSSLYKFPAAFLALDETIKKKYAKEAYEMFELYVEKYGVNPYNPCDKCENLCKLIECLLELLRPFI